MSDTYKGYPIDLLMKIKHLGRSVVGNDALYDTAQEYTDPSKGGGSFGPAITARDASQSVTPPQPRSKPAATLPVPTVALADSPADPWEGLDVLDLKALMSQHGITPPRTLTVGKAISLLEAAGVTSPTQAPK
jgi:hypothetical protein